VRLADSLAQTLNSAPAIFSRLLPFAPQHGCRLVLVNRRGYPGAEPYDADDMEILHAAQQATPAGLQAMSDFMRAAARGVHKLLEDFIAEEDPPVAGGIVLAGWSMCGAWLTALLAHAHAFPVNEVDVVRYVRRVVTFGALPSFSRIPRTSGGTPIIHPRFAVPRHRLLVPTGALQSPDGPYYPAA
jgi:hypothetical protein